LAKVPGLRRKLPFELAESPHMVLVCTVQFGWKLPKANTANVER
jgi:hypothetical protein